MLRPIFDQPWHRLALGGNPQAIDLLAQAALAPLYQFCFYRVGRNRHLCEEVVQETLLGAIRELARYEPGRAAGNIFPWLTGLARNHIRRVLARENAESLQTLWNRMDAELRELYARLESEPFGQEVLVREETRRDGGGHHVAQLPPQYREALEAKYVAGRSVRDMAADWGTSEKAVESQLTRARKAFRATFLALAKTLSWEGY